MFENHRPHTEKVMISISWGQVVAMGQKGFNAEVTLREPDKEL